MIAKYLAIILAGTLLGTTAKAAEWSIDKAHSSIGFAVKHMVVSTVRGSFGTYESKIAFEPPELKTFSAELTIETASINTGEERRDNHLRSADFFDAEKFPQITFKSKKIESLGEHRYRVIGDLTMKGVTKEVVLEGEGFSSQLKNPWGKMVTAVSAKGRLNREDFGLMWNVELDGGGVLVSKDVTLEIELEMVKN